MNNTKDQKMYAKKKDEKLLTLKPAVINEFIPNFPNVIPIIALSIP